MKLETRGFLHGQPGMDLGFVEVSVTEAGWVEVFGLLAEPLHQRPERASFAAERINPPGGDRSSSGCEMFHELGNDAFVFFPLDQQTFRVEFGHRQRTSRCRSEAATISCSV